MNPEKLKLLVTREMPFGKYKGRLIADLPGHYLNWFAREGFPKGEFGGLAGADAGNRSQRPWRAIGPVAHTSASVVQGQGVNEKTVRREKNGAPDQGAPKSHTTNNNFLVGISRKG